jgi:hypothetical protein
VGSGPVGEVAQRCACGPCRSPDSSRAGEWQAANSDSGRPRYTWQHMSTVSTRVQELFLRLHGSS